MYASASSHSGLNETITIPLFSIPVRLFWASLLIFTLTSELVPLLLTFEARYPPSIFYCYVVAKLIVFLIFGFLTPLAWSRFRTLGIGTLSAIGTTAAVELIQGLIPGHRTSVIELAVKLALLFVGFAFALDLRETQQLVAGPLRIRLSSPLLLPRPENEAEGQPFSTIPPRRRRIAIGHASVDPLSFREVVSDITEHVRSRGEPVYVVTPNAQHIVLLATDLQLREIYAKAHLIVPDGASLLLAARALGRRFKERVTGVDLFQALCRSAAESGMKVFFLGGLPGSADQAAFVLRKQFHGLEVATFCPPLGFEQSQAELSRIEEAVTSFAPDLLFVALGAPKQEYWIHNHGLTLGARVSIGVGGGFEMVAGVVPRAPRWIQRLGCEWVYRLCREPRRMWRRYLIGNAQFGWIILKQALTRGIQPPAASAIAASLGQGH